VKIFYFEKGDLTMSKKNKTMATWAFYLLIGGLLVYAASRTLHFVQNVMSDPIYGYLFLLSTGVGALIWLYVYLSYAQGVKQRAIAFVMGIVDMLGEMCLVYADTMFVGDKAGLVRMTPDDMHNFVIVSVATVAINIMAGYFFKLWDLNAEQDQHAQDLVDHVTEATMNHLNTPEALQTLVQELMPTLSDSIRARVANEVFQRAGQHGGVSAVGTVFSPPAPVERKELSLPFLFQWLGKNRYSNLPEEKRSSDSETSQGSDAKSSGGSA